jgi:hypothetical protein
MISHTAKKTDIHPVCRSYVSAPPPFTPRGRRSPPPPAGRARERAKPTLIKGPPMDVTHPGSLGLSDYLGLVRRHWWVVLALTAVGVAGAEMVNRGCA